MEAIVISVVGISVMAVAVFGWEILVSNSQYKRWREQGLDNYSAKGNTNPYTSKHGHVTPKR